MRFSRQAFRKIENLAAEIFGSAQTAEIQKIFEVGTPVFLPIGRFAGFPLFMGSAEKITDIPRPAGGESVCRKNR